MPVTQVQSPVLVGRDHELALLEDSLLAALRGECRIAVLSGEAGIGKSRLTGELLKRAASLGCVTLVGECPETDMSVPYLPFVEALGNHLAGVADIDALRDALGSATAPLSQLFPVLGTPDLLFDPSGTPLDKLRLFEAMVALVRAIAPAPGLVLVVEDVHWADRASQELLDYLARRLRVTGLMLLVTYRSMELDRHHPLLPTLERWRKAGLSEAIALGPLNVEGVRAMVAAIVDNPHRLAEVAAELHDRAEGIPFAVEELLRDAVERGRMSAAGNGGTAGTRQQTPPPRSLADNILLRIERLAEAHAGALRCAAVLGRSFDFALLADLIDISPDALIEALAACVDAQLIEEDPMRENGYRFRHVLVRDAVYEGMIVSRRRQLHSRAADAVRAMPSGEPAELAYHLIAAGRLGEAGAACAAAAEVALRRLAPEEACDLLARALAHTGDPLEHARLRCRLGEAWHQAGDVARAEQQLQAGVTALENAGEAAAAAHHRLSLGRCCWERARYEAAREHYERARAVLEPLGPSEDLATAYIRLSGLHSGERDAVTAQRLAERAIEIAEAAGAEAARITATDWLGIALCHQGRLDEGLAQLLSSAEQAGASRLHTLEARVVSHALSLLESYGRVGECSALLERLHALPSDPWIQVVAPYYEGWVRFWSADLRGAARSASACLDLATRFGMDTQVAWGRGLLCAVATELGDLEAARRLLPERNRTLERQELLEQGWASLRYGLAIGDTAGAASLAAELSQLPEALAGTELSDTVVETLIAAGRTPDAERLMAAMAVQPRARIHEGHALRGAARLLLAAGDAPAATASLREAAQVFAASGYRLEELRTGLVLAEAEAAGGDPAAAARTLEAVLEGARAGGAVTLAGAAIAVAGRLEISLADAAPPQPLDVDVEAHSSARNATVAGDELPVGERLVSVLFADVRGFTALSNERAPADVADRIATLQRWTVLAVERHHGIVDKFAGDAIMATFNATGWHVDHTGDALEVAFALMGGSARLELSLGAGIAVGPAIVGRLAAGANLSVLGAATNLAARLQAEAGAGEILMSEDAFARVRDSLKTRVSSVERCVLELKGFDAPVPAVRLIT